MKISPDTVRQAFWNWFQVKDLTLNSAVRNFYRFTGVSSFLDDHYDLTPEQVRRLTWMASLHGQVLIRAFDAQDTPNEHTNHHF